VFANSKKFQYFPTGQNVVREEKLPNWNREKLEKHLHKTPTDMDMRFITERKSLNTILR
jgi:hypothetical protein